MVNRNIQPLLGLPNCLRMNLITLKNEVYQVDLNEQKSPSQKLFNDYDDIFADELGSLRVTYSMKLNPNVSSVV